MSSVIKEGFIEKWCDETKSFRPIYAKLLSNGNFQWFEASDSPYPLCSIDVKSVSAFLAFGGVLNQVPCRPQAFSESDVDRSFGIPHEAHPDTRVTFFRCTSKAEMAAWMDCVNKLLFDNVGSSQSEVVPQNIATVQSGPYQSYGSYPPMPNTGQPPLPGAYGSPAYPGPSQPGGYPSMQPPPMGVPSYGPPYGGAPPPMQPGAAAYGAYPPSNYPAGAQPAVGPNYGYYPGGQNYPGQPVVGQQGAPDPQQVMYDKNGKPYTIVYKNGKPKKKKWKKAALGLAAGAATGWVAGKMFGGLGRTLGYGLGGWGGGWGRPAYGYGGFGRCGSWSSLSSFSSSGSWSS
ncbi:hypothetical protein Aperf_G00000109319 [Anoplocephala perfoliata]